MIRYNTIFCKLFSAKSLSWTPGKRPLVCPECGSRGNCAAHASYERSVIEYKGGRVVYGTVEIKRVLCSSCRHTHAIIPDYIIPYSSYSLLFILRVLAIYFMGIMTVEQLCGRFSISPSMLYRWKALFLEHKKLWLGVLEDAEASPLEFLRGLFALPEYSASFGRPFFSKTARSFLQSHKDAAYWRHVVF